MTIEEIVISRVLDYAFDALEVGVERDVIIAQAKAMEAKGATPIELVGAIRKLRDDAIAAAQGTIDKAP